MRNLLSMTFAAVWLVIAGSGPAFGEGSDGPLSDPILPALPDPSLLPGSYFPSSLTTAGVADTGSALNSVRAVDRGHAGCTVMAPCAVPSPALDHAIAARAE